MSKRKTTIKNARSEIELPPVVGWLGDSSAVPCPTWCDGEHAADDEEPDRTHWSSYEHSFQPLLMNREIFHLRQDGSGLYDHHGWELKIFAHQGWRTTEPTISIAPDMTGGPLGEGLELTVDEAVRVHAALGELLSKVAGR